MKKLQRVFRGDFRAVRRKQACFLITHTHMYVHRRTQTHNPRTYCARVNIHIRLQPYMHYGDHNHS